MAQPLVRALTERGERVRIYMPFGELIPGMGYLVRRLLENTSNESFLRRGFAEHEPPEVLLANPARAPGAAALSRASSRTSGGRVTMSPVPPFTNEPHTDFALARERVRFRTALDVVRRQLGHRYPLVIGGERVETARQLVSVNPSRADEIVGETASASPE